MDDLEANDIPNATSDLVRRLDPDCNPSNYGPLLQYGPRFCGFPDQNKYNMGTRAFIDSLRLMHAARRVLEKCDESPILKRYFDIDTPGVREKVRAVFMALLGDSGFGAAEFQDPGFEYEIWWRYGSESKQKMGRNSCQDRFKTYGYTLTSGWDPRSLITVLCPVTFYAYTPALEFLSCDQLDNFVSLKMMVPGSMLLHELMHWARLTLAHAELTVVDWNAAKDPNVNPPSGYGPYHAELLQKQKKDPVINADSYVWFALEAYWSEKCGRTFESQLEDDPVDDREQNGPDNEVVNDPPP